MRTLTLKLLNSDGEIVRTLEEPISDSVGNITTELSDFNLPKHYQIYMEVKN